MFGMIKYQFVRNRRKHVAAILLAGTLLFRTSLAVEIAVPPPKEMINKADIVAVGHVEWSRDSVIFTPDEVLKGAIKTGQEYPIRSPFPAESFSEKQLISVTHGEKFMLVARWSKDATAIHPIYGLCSAWPQGTTAELLPERTLAKCISFARLTLGVPLTRTLVRRRKR